MAGTLVHLLCVLICAYDRIQSRITIHLELDEYTCYLHITSILYFGPCQTEDESHQQSKVRSKSLPCNAKKPELCSSLASLCFSGFFSSSFPLSAYNVRQCVCLCVVHSNFNHLCFSSKLYSTSMRL